MAVGFLLGSTVITMRVITEKRKPRTAHTHGLRPFLLAISAGSQTNTAMATTTMRKLHTVARQGLRFR